MSIVGFSKEEEAGILEFKARVLREFGDRIVLLKLFGSKVKGESWEESDIDLLVLVDRLTLSEKKRIIDLSTEVNIDREILLSPLVMTPDEFQHLLKRERRIATDIEKEGLTI